MATFRASSESPATGMARRPGVPAGTPLVRWVSARAAFHALTTGRPSSSAVYTLSTWPLSTASIGSLSMPG